MTSPFEAGGRSLTYDELAAAAARLELPTGAPVAIIAPNVPAFPIALRAVWDAGAVAVPLSARSREHELEATLGASGAVSALVVAEHGGYSYADALERLAPGLPALRGWTVLDAGGEVVERHGEMAAPGDSDIAAVLFTSGSSGTPKGAMLTHAALDHWASTVAELLHLSPDDRTALVIPCSHAFGFASLLASLHSGGTTVLVDSPRALGEAVATCTVLHGSPAVFSGVSLRGIRTGLIGGAAAPAGLIEQLEPARILNVFGMTEVGAACACRSDDDAQTRYETAGRAMPGYDVRVQDGILEVRGTGVARGYLGQEPFGEWFRTGDMAGIDGDGRVTVHGRAEEVIHVGGFNVFPAEVENFLLTHPDVAQAAVLGGEHPRMGEVVRAFVVARPGAELTPGALLRFARGRIAGYKVPYGIEILDELPRLPGGKVDKGALR